MYFWELECFDSLHTHRTYFYCTTTRAARSLKHFMRWTPERMRVVIDDGEYSPILVRPISPLTYLFRKYLFCPSNGVRVNWERE